MKERTDHISHRWLDFRGLGIRSVEEAMSRTTILDFVDALRAIDARLKKYEPVKQGKWKTQSVQEHGEHCRDHIVEGAGLFHIAHRLNVQRELGLSQPDLVAAALRALMALQVFLSARPEPEPESPVTSE